MTTAEDPTRTAAVLLRSSLVKRLVTNHGLDPFEAFTAVSAIEEGIRTPHARIVTEEAGDLYRDMYDRLNHMFVVQFRTLIEGFERLGPVVGNVARTFAQMHTDAGTPVGQVARERPSWVSPYGPRTRRRPR